MSRRTVAGLLAFGLVVVLAICAALVHVPYVQVPAGSDDQRARSLRRQADHRGLRGTRCTATNGGLRMVTIIPERAEGQHQPFRPDARLGQPPTTRVLPKDAVYKRTQTSQAGAAGVRGADVLLAGRRYRSGADRSRDRVRDRGLRPDRPPWTRAAPRRGRSRSVICWSRSTAKTAKTTSGFIALVRAVKPGKPSYRSPCCVNGFAQDDRGDHPAEPVEADPVPHRYQPEPETRS